MKNITLLTELIPLLFCILFIRRKRLNTKSLKVFFIYSIFQVITAISISFFVHYFKSYSGYLSILRSHLLLEFFFLSLFFYYLIENQFFRKVILILILPYVFYVVYDYMINGNLEFNYFPTALEFLIFIIYSIFYFFEVIQNHNLPVTPIYKNILFCISVGLFFYFTGNFFYILLVKNSISAGINVQEMLIVIYSCISILKNFILGFSFFTNYSSPPPSSSISYPEELDIITPKNIIN